MRVVKWVQDVWDDYYDLFIVFVVMFGGIALLVGFLMGGDYFWSRYECGRKADKMELEHDYGFWTGCRVEVNGRLIDMDDYRVVEELVEDER